MYKYSLNNRFLFLKKILHIYENYINVSLLEMQALLFKFIDSFCFINLCLYTFNNFPQDKDFPFKLPQIVCVIVDLQCYRLITKRTTFRSNSSYFVVIITLY